MMPPMHSVKFAIVDSNVLAGLGLKQLIDNIMPGIDIDIYTRFEELELSNETYVHYFVGSRVYFENTSFFRSGNHRSIVLVAGDMQVKGVTTLNVCQSEQQIAKSIVGIMHAGHKGHAGPPQPFRHTKKDSGPLSARESEVAMLMAKGNINKEIADILGIAPTTVITHRKSIMEKLHARSLADVTIYAVLNGLIDVAEL